MTHDVKQDQRQLMITVHEGPQTACDDKQNRRLTLMTSRKAFMTDRTKEDFHDKQDDQAEKMQLHVVSGVNVMQYSINERDTQFQKKNELT